MLLAMTMNGYVILCIAFGTGMGKTVATMMNNSFKSQNNQDKSCQLQKN
jgi:hypothetical protein